jgi:oxidoreductase family protein
MAAQEDNDPRPAPPVRPNAEDCCKGSCDPCIFDLYADALDRYAAELHAWEERQARKNNGVL